MPAKKNDTRRLKVTARRPAPTDESSTDRAVSPVIGVILMVAITVILAAVIGAFVLDMGNSVQNTGPSASMGFEDADAQFTGSQDFIVIEHQSGEPLDADAIRIVVRNASDNSIVAEWDAGGGEQEGGTWSLNGKTFGTTNTVQVGDLIVISDPSASSGGDYDITVISTETDNRIATGTVEVQ